jgi:hypothetical protein
MKLPLLNFLHPPTDSILLGPNILSTTCYQIPPPLDWQVKYNIHITEQVAYINF